MQSLPAKRVMVAVALALAGQAAQAEPADIRARRHYALHCIGCHLADGSGAPEKGIPGMRGTLAAFLAVPGGREYLVQVPGVMNSGLSDHDVAELMNWLIPRMSDGAGPLQPPYTAQEIGRLRASRPLDIAATRRRLLDRMAPGR